MADINIPFTRNVRLSWLVFKFALILLLMDASHTWFSTLLSWADQPTRRSDCRGRDKIIWYRDAFQNDIGRSTAAGDLSSICFMG